MFFWRGSLTVDREGQGGASEVRRFSGSWSGVDAGAAAETAGGGQLDLCPAAEKFTRDSANEFLVCGITACEDEDGDIGLISLVLSLHKKGDGLSDDGDNWYKLDNGEQETGSRGTRARSMF